MPWPASGSSCRGQQELGKQQVTLTSNPKTESKEMQTQWDFSARSFYAIVSSAEEKTFQTTAEKTPATNQSRCCFSQFLVDIAQHSLVYCVKCLSFRQLLDFSVLSHGHNGVSYNVSLQWQQMFVSNTTKDVTVILRGPAYTCHQLR